MQHIDNLELRSPETKEIVSKPPHWLVKWSISIIILFFIVLILILYYIKTPLYLNNIDIKIFPNEPIKSINLKNGSNIYDIRVTNGQKVKKQQTLLVVDSDNDDLKKQLVISPIDGTIWFEHYLHKGQYIEKESPFFIVPANNIGFTGIMKMDVKSASKLKKNISVSIKLNSYPEEKYGKLKGFVSNHEFLVRGDTAYVEIYFDNNLITDKKIKLNYLKNFQGFAEIELEKQRLLYKFFK